MLGTIRHGAGDRVLLVRGPEHDAGVSARAGRNRGPTAGVAEAARDIVA